MKCAVILQMRARFSFRSRICPGFSLPWAKYTFNQYDSQITNETKGDKGKCTAAKALLEEALSLLRAHSQDDMAAEILMLIAWLWRT